MDTQGDAFFFSFTRAKDAVAGAVAAQRDLADARVAGRREVKVRMGLHTGEPTVGEEGYLGMDVVRAARICSAGHGGQILLSETTRALVGNDVPDGVVVRDLGEAHLKDIQHERIFELALADSPATSAAEDGCARTPQPTTWPPRFSAKSTSRSSRASTAAGAARRSSNSSLVGLVNRVPRVAAAVAIFLIVKAVL